MKWTITIKVNGRHAWKQQLWSFSSWVPSKIFSQLLPTHVEICLLDEAETCVYLGRFHSISMLSSTRFLWRATYYVEEVSIIISVFSHVLHAIEGWLCCHFDCHGGPGAFPAFADTTFPLHDELLQCKHNPNTSTFLDATTIACWRYEDGSCTAGECLVFPITTFSFGLLTKTLSYVGDLTNHM